MNRRVNVATITANIAGLKRTIPLSRLRTRAKFKLQQNKGQSLLSTLLSKFET
jgi:hypothetical protein